MRKSPILASLVLCLAAPAAFAAGDEDPWYLQFSLGAGASPNIDAPGDVEVGFDLGFATSIAVGRDMGQSGNFSWSLEGEVLYTYYNLDEDDLAFFPSTTDKGESSVGLMANVVGAYELTSAISLYAAGGAGFSTINFKTFDSGNLEQLDNDAPSFQFKAGLKYKMGPKFDILLGFRYYVTDSIDIFNQSTGNTTSVEYEDSVVELGFRWGI